MSTHLTVVRRPGEPAVYDPDDATEFDGPRDLVAAAEAAPRAFAGACRGITSDLQDAITRMDADDISLDIDASNDGQRTNFRVKLRAYRHRSDEK